MSKVKFLLVDDHPIIRIGARQLILQEWPTAEIEEADSLESAIQRARSFAPSVVVLDLVLPDAAGTEGVVRMMRAVPDTPILILTFSSEDAHALRLLQMGVAGYLPKDRAGQELVNALKRLLSGGRYVTPAMADQLVNSLGGRGGAALPHEELSAQEHRIMLLIAAGRTPSEIAEIMHLSVKTVGSYRARILQKTGWKNNIELVKYCVQRGLVESGVA